MDQPSAAGFHEELHQDLLPWLVTALASVGLLIALLDPIKAPPPSPVALGFLMLGLAAVVWRLRKTSHVVAAWVTDVGMLLLVLLAWHWIPSSDVHHALVLTVIAAGLMQGATASVLLSLLASLALFFSASPSGPSLISRNALVSNVTILWLTTFLMCISQHVQKTMIAGVWERYRQARSDLEDARDRRLELKHALEDLALANSEMVRLNNLLFAAREAVEEARRTKEEFVANVSHELRNPLSMIIGFSDEILERPHAYTSRLPQDLLEDVTAIRRNSKHLARLVDDVLDLSQVDAGYMTLFVEKTPIREVVEEAAEAVALLFKKKGLTLSVDIPHDYPSVDCDRARIRQVIINLLSNAGRFTETGGARIHGTLRNEMIVVSVTDTGSGVDHTTAGRLFQPFQQADPSLRRRHGGTGLGLAISKRFIEMHGGKIWLESELGRGTTVSFSLPVHRPSREERPRRWFSPYQDLTPRTRRSLAPRIETGPQVVIFEEGNTLSRLAERYLDKLEPVTVHTVQEAAEAVESGTMAAVLINAPALPGRASAIKKLSGAGFDIPIMSCWVPEHHTKVGEMNVQDYLVKPILRSQLLDSIRKGAPGARSILVVDDDPEARQLFGRMLTTLDRGYEVLSAGDGATALAVMRERQPDLLLLDLVMPNQDGFAVLAAKAADPLIRHIPVIVVSAKDPQREPIVTEALVLTRQRGLSPHDLMLAVETLTYALPPRFGVRAQRETLAPSLASE